MEEGNKQEKNKRKPKIDRKQEAKPYSTRRRSVSRTETDRENEHQRKFHSLHGFSIFLKAKR